MKSILFTVGASIAWFGGVAFFLSGCQPTPPAVVEPIILEGTTMGTYYRITYLDSAGRNLQPEVEAILREVNAEVSTYIDSAVISRFNRANSGLRFDNLASGLPRHFLANLSLARQVYTLTGGAYDCTVMPLVNYWGFGYTPKKPVTRVDSLVIDSLRHFIGMDKVALQETADSVYLAKTLAGVQLDFSSCAKGYGVDEVGRLMEAQGITNYLVDIGGEARARGQSPRGDHWRVGINRPSEDAALTDVELVIALPNISIATSGNYRNYYEVNGQKYSHTINPLTGFPERTRLLSASVFAADCMTADAYATACMVMGLERALALVEGQPDLEAYFIFAGEDGSLQVRHTAGAAQWLVSTPTAQ